MQDLHHLMEYKHFVQLLDGGYHSILMGKLLDMMYS